jgi:hypothetical protein
MGRQGKAVGGEGWDWTVPFDQFWWPDVREMQPSIYHRGLMVGETPNIDRIGNEGAIFTAAKRLGSLGSC